MALEILVPWILAGALLALAGVALARARAAAATAAERAAALEELRSELAAEHERLAASEARRSRASDEIAGLRHKLDKARKRAGKADRAPREAAAAASQDPARDAEAARQQRDAAIREARERTEEVAKLEATLRRQAVAKPLLDNPAIEALQRRAEGLVSELGARTEDLDTARKEAERLRQKVKTQEQLYLSIRGDLQAKKDRLRTQTEEIERLRALEVVLNRSPD